MKTFSKNFISGFTLVEMIVVIAIIAILTGIVTTNFTKSKAKARDAQRISDTGQLQLALSLYFDRCAQYPTSLVLTANNGCTSNPAITFASYIGKIPTPPVGASQTTYDYAVNSASRPTDYVLHAKLEDTNSATKNSLTSPAPSNYTVVTGNTFTCSDAAGSKDYCIGPK